MHPEQWTEPHTLTLKSTLEVLLQVHVMHQHVYSSVNCAYNYHIINNYIATFVHSYLTSESIKILSQMMHIVMDWLLNG